jgi:hypothetical protein
MIYIFYSFYFFHFPLILNLIQSLGSTFIFISTCISSWRRRRRYARGARRRGPRATRSQVRYPAGGGVLATPTAKYGMAQAAGSVASFTAAQGQDPLVICMTTAGRRRRRAPRHPHTIAQRNRGRRPPRARLPSV